MLSVVMVERTPGRATLMQGHSESVREARFRLGAVKSRGLITRFSKSYLIGEQSRAVLKEIV